MKKIFYVWNTETGLSEREAPYYDNETLKRIKETNGYMISNIMEVHIGERIDDVAKRAVKMGGSSFMFSGVYCNVKPDDDLDKFYQFYHSKYASGYTKEEYIKDKIQKIL